MIEHRLLRAILFAGFLGASTAPVFAEGTNFSMPGDHLTGTVELSIDDGEPLGLVTWSRTIASREAPAGTAPEMRRPFLKAWLAAKSTAPAGLHRISADLARALYS